MGGTDWRFNALLTISHVIILRFSGKMRQRAVELSSF